MSAALCEKFILSPTCMLVVSPGSRKLVLSDFRIPQGTFPVFQFDSMAKKGAKKAAAAAPKAMKAKKA